MASAPISFYERVDKGLHDDVMRRALGNGTSTFTTKREVALGTLPNPDDLRDQARLMRRHTIANLDTYLAQFAESVERAGGVVHWALDADHARQIVLDIAQQNDVQRIIKSKSMVTEEIHLNAALEANNLEVVETDLGEYIAQIDHDHPSHIIVPVLHKTRQQIGRLFTDELGVEYTDDPTTLAKIARRTLREKFLAADMGISGVNFGVASTGTLTIVTNEGNARMSTTMPRIHVAMMGLERLVPTPADLTLGLQLLARSATGQKLTVYTSFITGPKRAADSDGPEQLHVILVDNGRSKILRTDLAEILTVSAAGLASTPARCIALLAVTLMVTPTPDQWVVFSARYLAAWKRTATCHTPRRCAARAVMFARYALTCRSCCCGYETILWRPGWRRPG